MEHGQHTRSCYLISSQGRLRGLYYSCGYMLYFYLSWDGYYAYLGCLPLLSAVTAFLHCILVVLLKKVIIGKFARGDHGFYCATTSAGP